MISKQQLLKNTTNLFIDNCYLDQYVVLINNNVDTKRQLHKTQKHHIIPKSYYKQNNVQVDNSRNNMVNLMYKDHIIAHCLLSLCTEGIYKYFNNISKYIIPGHEIKDMNEQELALYQMSYESSQKVTLQHNPMFNEEGRQHHRSVMQSEQIRKKISDSMKEYRRNVPFSDEHRRNLSLAMTGNHNFGTGDTRSIPCRCVDTNGDILHFHSYKQGGIWWFNKYKPFGDRYVQVTLQRKIVKSINDNIQINGVQWYRDEYDQSVETIERIDEKSNNRVEQASSEVETVSTQT